MDKTDAQLQQEAWNKVVDDQSRLDAHFQAHGALSNEEILLLEERWADVVKHGRIRKVVGPFAVSYTHLTLPTILLV